MGFLDNTEKWFSDREKDVENTFKWGVNKGVGVITHTEDSVTSIISTPLLIISIGIAAILWKSNLGQVADITKNVGPVVAGG